MAFDTRVQNDLDCFRLVQGEPQGSGFVAYG
jgi:hypothetical protein